ncbi:Uncharacterized conserved protein [Pricia antarctica]|uniref:Uncharacterized conserved protein n=1 Tax=Pricia antarctica TaxID=641691 RepID=A0A1G6Y9M6_9FLAO|nr:hypothetical protein [Pricia antarctica]SDD86286.1 Uncharacterized conserved protein [Pricia antarctica]
MKKTLVFVLFVAALGFISCEEDKDDILPDSRDYLIATPLTTALTAFKEEAVSVTEPVAMQESGKIYAYKNYVFVNDVNRGFHILENSDPSAPKNIGFIKLEGNYDISIKDDRLYADSYGDLVVLDISDIENIPPAKRIKNAIYQPYTCTVGFDVAWPHADFYDYGDMDFTKEAVIGWEVKTEHLSNSEFEDRFGYNPNAVYYEDSAAFNNLSSSDAAAPSAPETSTTGQGGSLARFRIVGDYLYAVEWSSINIFDISNLDSPKTLQEVYTNGAIETIYNQGDILFLGGQQGMYIYDISSPETPIYISEFIHGTACDPVVVDGDYAYVTLKGDTWCGNTESGLYIVNLKDLKNPVLQKFYPLNGPNGLGFKDDKLFICDGSDGLKVYDKSNVDDLKLLNHFKDIVTYDVIPLQNSLLMIGDKVLYQYKYFDDNIRLLSTFDLK